MVQSCLRTKLCKLCWTFLLVFLCCVSLALWFRAVQEGSVQLVIPGEPPDSRSGVYTVIIGTESVGEHVSQFNVSRVFRIMYNIIITVSVVPDRAVT